MRLRGQLAFSGKSGYAMAALLVAMSVMAVMMSVAMPVWNQAARREKEAELIFRGEQYARAIGLFQRKYANAAPPDLDVLVRERFLRKKYKDPITNADFVPIAAAPPAGPAGTGGGGRATLQPAGPGGAAGGGGRGALQPPTAPGGAAGGRGGIIGVTSSSTRQSIRVYNGATRYDQWRFVYAPPTLAPGTGQPGTAMPGLPSGGRGGRGAGQGDRGLGPGLGAPARGGPGSAPSPSVPPGRGR